MNFDIQPQPGKPRSEKIAHVSVFGCEFVVGWDGEPGEPFERHDMFGSGATPPTAWCEFVKLDGKWWDVYEVFSPEFAEQLNDALLRLEDFSACKK